MPCFIYLWCEHWLSSSPDGGRSRVASAAIISRTRRSINMIDYRPMSSPPTAPKVDPWTAKRKTLRHTGHVQRSVKSTNRNVCSLVYLFFWMVLLSTNESVSVHHDFWRYINDDVEKLWKTVCHSRCLIGSKDTLSWQQLIRPGSALALEFFLKYAVFVFV